MFILFQVTKMFLWVLVLANPAADPHHDISRLKDQILLSFYSLTRQGNTFFDKSNPVQLS